MVGGWGCAVTVPVGVDPGKIRRRQAEGGRELDQVVARVWVVESVHESDSTPAAAWMQGASGRRVASGVRRADAINAAQRSGSLRFGQVRACHRRRLCSIRGAKHVIRVSEPAGILRSRNAALGKESGVGLSIAGPADPLGLLNAAIWVCGR